MKDELNAAKEGGAADAEKEVFAKAESRLDTALQNNHMISLHDLKAVLQTATFKGDLVAIAEQTIDSLGDQDYVFDAADSDENEAVDKCVFGSRKKHRVRASI